MMREANEGPQWHKGYMTIKWGHYDDDDEERNALFKALAKCEQTHNELNGYVNLALEQAGLAWRCGTCKSWTYGDKQLVAEFNDKVQCGYCDDYYAEEHAPYQLGERTTERIDKFILAPLNAASPDHIRYVLAEYRRSPMFLDCRPFWLLECQHTHEDGKYHVDCNQPGIELGSTRQEVEHTICAMMTGMRIVGAFDADWNLTIGGEEE